MQLNKGQGKGVRALEGVAVGRVCIGGERGKARKLERRKRKKLAKCFVSFFLFLLFSFQAFPLSPPIPSQQLLPLVFLPPVLLLLIPFIAIK